MCCRHCQSFESTMTWKCPCSGWGPDARHRLDSWKRRCRRFGEGRDTTAELVSFETILNLVYLSSFFLLFLYGQRLQLSLALVTVKRSLGRLEGFRTLARSRFLESVLKYNKNNADVETRIQR